jgi:Glycosyl transferase family 2
MNDIFELPPGYDADVICTPAALRLRSQANPQVDLSLFVSLYNEEEFIAETLDRTCIALQELGGVSFELIVVDDCSTDRSVALVKEFIGRHPDDAVILRCNRKNRGLSQNYVDHAFFGIGTYYRLVCGDTSESVEMMKRIYSAIGSADIIIPYYPESVTGKSLIRRIISKTFVAVINVVTWQNIHYYNGLPVHRRFHVMRWHPTSRGFGFQADILCMLLEQGYTYKEVPVLVTERKLVNSTALSWSNLLSVTHTILNIFIRRLARRVHEGNARRLPR